MQPGPTVNADGEEPKADAELVEQPVAGLGHVGSQAPELRPGHHGGTLGHLSAAVVKEAAVGHG
jgi:hypothetical protein